jgi:hypothetical protein
LEKVQLVHRSWGEQDRGFLGALFVKSNYASESCWKKLNLFKERMIKFKKKKERSKQKKNKGKEKSLKEKEKKKHLLKFWASRTLCACSKNFSQPCKALWISKIWWRKEWKEGAFMVGEGAKQSRRRILIPTWARII